jgi:pentose-5-phosphate-3-epimerase
LILVGWDSWIRTVEIEPAIAGADAAAREHSVEALLRAGCKVIHLNTVGLGSRQETDAVALLAPLVHRYGGVLDVHATAEFRDLAAAGADSITFDAGADVPGALELVHDTGAQAGVAFGNEIPEEEVAEQAASADLVLCSGEGDGEVARVRRLSELLPSSVTIQVDGEIRFDNVRSLYRAGARLLVAREAIFEREDLPRAYRRLVQALA